MALGPKELIEIIEELDLNALTHACDAYRNAGDVKPPILTQFEGQCRDAVIGTIATIGSLHGDTQHKVVALIAAYEKGLMPEDNQILCKLLELTGQIVAPHQIIDLKQGPIVSKEKQAKLLQLKKKIAKMIAEKVATFIKEDGDLELKRFLARSMTPNQHMGITAEELISLYLPYIPDNIKERIEQFFTQVLSILKDPSYSLKSQLENIISLYEKLQTDIEVLTRQFLYGTKPTIEEIEVPFKIRKSLALNQYIETKMSEKQRQEFSRAIFKKEFEKSYFRMCFQYINPVIEEKVLKQEHKFPRFMALAIHTIADQFEIQQIEDETKKDIMTNPHQRIAKIFFERLKEKLEGDKAGINNYRQALFKKVKKFYNQIETDKTYESIREYIKSVFQKGEISAKDAIELIREINKRMPTESRSIMDLFITSKAKQDNIARLMKDLMEAADDMEIALHADEILELLETSKTVSAPAIPSNTTSSESKATTVSTPATSARDSRRMMNTLASLPTYRSGMRSDLLQDPVPSVPVNKPITEIPVVAEEISVSTSIDNAPVEDKILSVSDIQCDISSDRTDDDSANSSSDSRQNTRVTESVGSNIYSFMSFTDSDAAPNSSATELNPSSSDTNMRKG